MTTQKYLLRLEGVNLGNFVFDTNDLATIRGGGLLLLQAAQDAGKWLTAAGGLNVMAISKGASIGLYEFDAPKEKIAEILQRLRTRLSERGYAYATFVVDCLPFDDDNNFRDTVEQLVALNRKQQYQTLSVGIMDLATETEECKREQASQPPSSPICVIDRVRPATYNKTVGGKAQAVSHAVYLRRQFGWLNKNRFFYQQLTSLSSIPQKEDFERLLQSTKNWRFTPDLSSLAVGADWGNMDGKMAIFYADGNSFSRFQRVKSKGDLVKWDESIRAQRLAFLQSVAEEMDEQWQAAAPPPGDNKSLPWINTQDKGDDERTENDSRTSSNKSIRFETLLWGGDEMIFVMPAWQGLAFAHKFLSFDWTYNGTKLTHATTLVFCHANAPIHPLTRLAHDLADHGKNASKREKNSLNYVVLESFDHTGAHIDQYHQRIYQNTLTVSDRTLLFDDQHNAIAALQTALRSLKEGLPHSRVHRVLRSLLLVPDYPPEPEDKSNHNSEMPQTYLCAVKMVKHDMNQDIQKLIDLVNRNFAPVSAQAPTEPLTPERINAQLRDARAGWSHVADLWDYVDLPPSPAAAGQTNQ